MEIAEHIDLVDEEGRRFLDAATTAGFGAAVPSCPGWTVGDLTRHLGTTHRWAGRIVAERAASGADVSHADILAAAPDDAGLAEWFADGHTTLLDALGHGSPDDDFWRFTRDAPSSLAFWARRQAHETAIHRVDADDAGRAAGAPFGARFAADGVDEMFEVFTRRARVKVESEQVFLAVADDIARRWHVTLGVDGVAVATDPDAIPGGAQLTISGPADALYRLLWNRLAPTSTQIRLAGEPAPLDAWRTSVVIA